MVVVVVVVVVVGVVVVGVVVVVVVGVVVVVVGVACGTDSSSLQIVMAIQYGSDHNRSSRIRVIRVILVCNIRVICNIGRGIDICSSISNGSGCISSIHSCSSSRATKKL